MFSMLMMTMIKKTTNYRIVKKKMRRMNKNLLKKTNNNKNINFNILKGCKINLSVLTIIAIVELNNNSFKKYNLIQKNINNFCLKEEIIIVTINKIILFQVILKILFLYKKIFFLKK